MASLNRVELIGNLGADPVIRVLNSGEAVANITLATTDTWKDKQTGTPKEYTEWHRVVLYRRLAEIARDYLKKGAQVYIEGRIRTRSWDKDGTTQYTTEIEATGLKMLGRRPSSEPRPESVSHAPAAADLSGDVPF